MIVRDPRHSNLIVALVVLALCLILFTAQFQWNALGLVEPRLFQTFQKDSESLIVGRMVQSRTSGLLSYGGLPGAGVSNDLHVDWLTDEQVAHQFETYLEGGTFETYSPYRSQIGGQGLLFSLLDRVLPFGPGFRLSILTLLAAIASAATLSVLILWFLRELGVVPAAFAGMAVLLNQSLVLMGGNLWWSLWAFYLPALSVLALLQHSSTRASRLNALFGVLVFFAVLAKCVFNGYEYVTTTLIMMTVPLVYYAVRYSWSWSRLWKVFAAATAGSAIAGVVTLAVLVVQIDSLPGNGPSGWVHIAMSIGKRTHGDPQAFNAVFARSLEAGILPVIGKYLRGSFLDLRHLFPSAGPFFSRFVLGFRYAYVVLLVIGTTAWLLLRQVGKEEPDQQRRERALALATLYSLAAPLSWFVVFKSHSYIHTGMNLVVWQMPFTLMGFATIGTACRKVLLGRLGISGNRSNPQLPESEREGGES